MAYYVKMEDVDLLEKQGASYQRRITEASEALMSHAENFSQSDAFMGEAGDSMKNYMLEVHKGLTDCLVSAIGQLITDYESEYSYQYSQSPVNGDHSGKYPESGLGKVAGLLQDVQQASIADAEGYLRRVSQHIPAGCSVSVPGTHALAQNFEQERIKTNQLKDHVQDAEAKGERAFSSASEKGDALLRSIKDTLAVFTSGAVAIGSYQRGTFAKIATTTGLRENCIACKIDQANKAEKCNERLKACLDNCQERDRIALEAAAKEKEKGAWWGLAAQAGLVILGAVALVGTAGAASPVIFALGAAMSAASLTSGIKGLDSRTRQISAMQRGDYGADLDDEKIKGESELKKGGKMTKDALKVEHELRRAPDLSRKIKKAGEHGYYRAQNELIEESQKLGQESMGMVSDIGKIGVDYVWDSATSGIKDERTKLKADVSKEAVDLGYDIVTEKIIKGSVKGGSLATGVAGFACNTVQAVADYHVEQQDKIIEKTQTSMDETQKIRAGVDGRTYSTAVSW